MGKLYTLDDLTAAERKKILPHLQQAIKLALGTYHDYALSDVPWTAIPNGFVCETRDGKWITFPDDANGRAGVEYIDRVVRLCKAPRTVRVGAIQLSLKPHESFAWLDSPHIYNSPYEKSYRQGLELLGGSFLSGKTYALRVVDAVDNSPIQGALVTANTFSGHTDSHGWFYFTGPAPVSYPYNIAYITVTAPGYIGTSFEYARPNPTIRLQPASSVTHKGITLTFHVVDQATQKPIAGARIAVNNTAYDGITPGGASGATAILTTDPNGNAHIYNAEISKNYGTISYDKSLATRVAKVTKQGYQVATVEVPVTGSKTVTIVLHKLQGGEVLAQVPDPIHLGTAPDFGGAASKYYITVKDAKTNAPIRGATVIGTGEIAVSTDSHGNAVLQFDSYHPPADVIVRVSKDGYEPVITAAAGRAGTGGYRCCDHLTFALSPVPVPKMSTVGGTTAPPGGTTGTPTEFFRSTAGRIVLWGGAAIILYWAIKKR